MSFDTMVPGEFGINTVRLAAVDTSGVEDTAICSFMLSDDWADESTGVDSSVSFTLRQEGVDDSSRSGASTSLGDLLHTAINSSGLSSSLDWRCWRPIHSSHRRATPTRGLGVRFEAVLTTCRMICVGLIR